MQNVCGTRFRQLLHHHGDGRGQIELRQFFLQDRQLRGFLFAGVIDVVTEILAEQLRLFFVPFLRLDLDDFLMLAGVCE